MEDSTSGHRKLCCELYKTYLESKDTIFYSPLGVHSLLAALYQGTSEETKALLESTVCIDDPNKAAEDYEKAFGQVNNLYEVKLSINSRILLSKDYKIKAEVKSVIQDKFKSEIESTDLSNKSAVADGINTWLKQKSRGDVKSLLKADDLNGSEKLILINSVYLKTYWEKRFDTLKQTFYLSPSEQVEVTYLTQMKNIFFKDDDVLHAQIIEIPFENSDISMVILHPYERRIGALEARLASFDLSQINEDMKFRFTHATFPLFKIDTLIELQQPLEKVGLGEIFDESKAKCNGLTDDGKPLAVGKVFQKVCLDLSHEGGIPTPPRKDSRGVAPKPQERIIVNSPFIVLFKVNDQNPYIIYYGKIVNPLK